MSETTSAARKAAAKAEEKPKVSERDKRIAAGQCVVDEGPNTVHVGRAVNGLVCSYHAMHYTADGTLRS